MYDCTFFKKKKSSKVGGGGVEIDMESVRRSQQVAHRDAVVHKGLESEQQTASAPVRPSGGSQDRPVAPQLQPLSSKSVTHIICYGIYHIAINVFSIKLFMR